MEDRSQMLSSQQMRAIDYWKLKKIKGFIIKLDIEKAFDKIDWKFIDYSLLQKNYSKKWRSWMQSCFSGA